MIGRRNTERTAISGGARPALALIVVLIGALVLVPGAAGAKKKKKSPNVLTVTKQVNAPIPEAGTGSMSPYGLLASTIDAGRQFKGTRIRDVNVTVQTTGLTGDNPTNDLEAHLTAPNGSTSVLFNGLGTLGTSLSIGPLTLDDESPLHLSDVFTPADPITLSPPWSGTAMPFTALAGMDGGPVRGTWTLRVTDGAFGGAETSLLNLWRLNVAAGKPYLTK